MDEKKFKCNECNKYYKSYQSLWNHKKKIHPIISSNIPILSSNGENNIPILSSNIPTKIKIKKTDQTQCDYCNKMLSSYKNLHRHIQKCKNKQDIIKENQELKLKTQQLEERILNIEQKLENITNKMELTTTNNTINNTTNNTSNSNNTITNNINIFKLGCETILENLPTEEILYILRLEKYNPLLEATKKTNFDKDHPEGHNWYNGNLRENFVTVYDKKTNKTIRDNKEETIEYVLQQRINELEELSYKHKDELTEEQINNIDNIVKNDYPPYVSEKVKTMAYQNKDMVIKTINKVIK